MASIQEINSSIMFGDLSNDQLNSIVSAIKFRRAQIAKQAVRTFWNGDRVKFVHPKTGQVHVGTVSKVAIKYISINAGGLVWRVPGNMVTAVEA